MQEQKFTEQRALLPFLKRMLTYSLRFKKWLYLFIFFTIITAIAEALMPLAVVELIDKVLTPQLEQYRRNPNYIFDFQPVMRYGLMYFGLAIVAISGIYQFIKYAGLLQENMIAALRQDLFEKLQRLHFGYYDRTASGWLLTRINSDTDRVAEVVSWGLVELVWGLCNVLFCILAMMLYNWQLALMVVFTVPTMILASVKVRQLVLKYSRDTRRLNSEIAAAYTEHINGVSVVKSTAQEDRVSEKFNVLSNQMREAQYRGSLYTALYLPLVVFVGALATAAVLFWGGKMTLALPFGISMGVYFAAFEYCKRIFEPISDITRFYATAQSSLAAGERIFSLLNEPILIKNTEGVVNSDFSAHRIEGNIEFQDVSFFYTKETYVLKNFNLKIKAGESVALVGATGEGKSTIASLVARFYEPNEGQILIDGIDYKTLPINTLRRQLGVVLQTPHIFSGTIKENILFGKLDASDAEIAHALKMLGADEFLTRLEEAVGESGERLSMGERQLLSLVRAVLVNPRIFIMDEATSSIDTLTEAKIQRGTVEILRGRTSLIIAHRLSTIKNCDRILVIEKGRVIEDGNHRALMLQRGYYFRLYTNQLRAERVSTILD